MSKRCMCVFACMCVSEYVCTGTHARVHEYGLPAILCVPVCVHTHVPCHVQIMYCRSTICASYRGAFGRLVPSQVGKPEGSTPPPALPRPQCIGCVRDKGHRRPLPNLVSLPHDLHENCSLFSHEEILLQFYFIIVPFRNGSPACPGSAIRGPWTSPHRVDIHPGYSPSASVRVSVSLRPGGGSEEGVMSETTKSFHTSPLFHSRSQGPRHLSRSLPQSSRGALELSSPLCIPPNCPYRTAVDGLSPSCVHPLDQGHD